MFRLPPAAWLVFLATPAALAGDELFDRPERPIAISSIAPFTGPEGAAQPVEPPAAAPASGAPAAAEFGAKGSRWWTFGIGIADNFVDATDFNIRGAWSHFVIRDLEFSAELNGWYMDQPGENVYGINPAFVFRWHLYNKGDWTIYTDAGIGLLFTTDDAPEGGTSFNFTPRFGGGATYKLDESGTRLQFGARWHHISNARIRGDLNNPARDGLMLYAGIIIPF